MTFSLRLNLEPGAGTAEFNGGLPGAGTLQRRRRSSAVSARRDSVNNALSLPLSLAELG